MASRALKIDVGSAVLHAGIGGTAGPFVVVPHPAQWLDADTPWLAAALEGAARWVTIHPRGAGESTGTDLSTDTLVADLDLVRRELGVDDWIIWGQSAGGTVAMLYALAYPDATRALVLSCASADGFSEESVYHPANPDNAAAVAAMTSGDRAALAGLIAHRPDLVTKDDRVGQSSARLAAHFAEKRPLLLPMLSTLTTPTLVIGGRHDRSIPLQHQERIASALPNAEFVVFENSGHFPYLEEPQRFAEVMRAFLTRVA